MYTRADRATAAKAGGSCFAIASHGAGKDLSCVAVYAYRIAVAFCINASKPSLHKERRINAEQAEPSQPDCSCSVLRRPIHGNHATIVDTPASRRRDIFYLWHLFFHGLTPLGAIALAVFFWLFHAHTGPAPPTPSLLRILSQLSASGKLNFTADAGPSKAWPASRTTPGHEEADGMLHPIHHSTLPASQPTTGRTLRVMRLDAGHLAAGTGTSDSVRITAATPQGSKYPWSSAYAATLYPYTTTYLFMKLLMNQRRRMHDHRHSDVEA
ncbi:hypothetical protein CMUS01_08520 [Colletotrichum musicola]|uniref:Uncharacterized protein n=1 Tax=Colletotrichum musicola TaxID=2175873 RepID=A0A8H6KBX8_9PEZI|nr:hypothetical protein CMUS01_08520 [Colletotrichum musicola]